MRPAVRLPAWLHLRLPTWLMLWVERRRWTDDPTASVAEFRLTWEDAKRRAIAKGMRIGLALAALLAAPSVSAQASDRPFVVAAAVADSAQERIRAQWPDSTTVDPIGFVFVAPDLCVVAERREKVGRTADGRDSVHATVFAVAEPTDRRCKATSPRVLFRASCEQSSDERMAEHVVQYVVMRRDYWLVACKAARATPLRVAAIAHGVRRG